MLSKPIAVGLLATACVAAGAGGAYLTFRQDNEAARLSARASAAALPVEPALPAVEETEALVTPVPAAGTEPELEKERQAPRVRRSRPAESAVAPPRKTPAVSGRTVTSPPQVAAPSVPVEETRAAAWTEALAAPEPPTVEPAARPEPPLPPMRLFEDLVVPASAVVGLQIETPVSSERARLEDRVEARVLRDVTVDGRAGIPAGSRVVGAVTLVDRGGKVTERARLGVRFHTLVLADGTQLPMRTDTIFREGDSPSGASARKIGGAAAGGAILGAILGGKKGAIVGGATGAAGGTAVVVAGDRNPATLPVGAVITVRLLEPLAVEVEKR